MIDRLGLLHRVDGQLDIHVALDLAAAERVGEFLGCLGDNLVAVVIEPVDQRADRGVFLIFDKRGVVVGAQKIAALLEGLEEFSVVDIEAECPGCRVEICAVDEEGDFLAGVEHIEQSFK
ncbi:hypothetical protein FQZ97_1126970 [compost metagenome]